MSITGKGVPGSVLKKKFTDIEYYKKVLYENKVATATYRQFQSKDHIVKHCDTTQVALSCENDKVFQTSPGSSRPLGRYKNKVLEPVAEEWALEDDEETVKLALKLLAEGGVLPPAVQCNDDDDDIVSTTAATNQSSYADSEDEDED